MSKPAANLEGIKATPTRFCTICRDAIPEKRATRNTATCTEKCKDALDQIKIEQRRLKMCPHCLHPASPAEREEFRRWRADRGNVKSAEPVRRDGSIAHKQDLERALKAAVKLLEAERDRIADGRCVKGENGIAELTTMDALARPDYEKLDSEIRRLKNLVDKKPAE